MGIKRKTKSIDLLLNEFDKRSEAISTVALIKLLSSQINKTTIYRVLDKLEDDGVLHSFIGVNGLKWYAKCDRCSYTEHKDVHPHFECLSCGKVDCVDVDVSIPKIPNREVSGSTVLIRGKCEECIN